MSELQTIDESALRSLPMLVKDGYWFRVTAVAIGKVFYVTGQQPHDFGESHQMPTAEFVRQFNAGKQRM